MNRSPYNLLQEIYLKDKKDKTQVWQMLVCCMLLNRTTRLQVDRVRRVLFSKWPSPESMSKAKANIITSVIKSLGFGDKRADGLIRMSKDFMNPWTDPVEIHGIGKYANDAYRIFVLEERVKNPGDHMLHAYQEWKYRGKVNRVLLEKSKTFDIAP